MQKRTVFAKIRRIFSEKPLEYTDSCTVFGLIKRNYDDFENRTDDDEQHERNRDVYRKNLQRVDKRRFESAAFAAAIGRNRNRGAKHETAKSTEEKRQINQKQVDESRRFVSTYQRDGIPPRRKTEREKRYHNQKHGFVVDSRNQKYSVAPKKRKQGYEKHFHRAKFHIRARNSVESVFAHRPERRYYADGNAQNEDNTRANNNLFIVRNKSFQSGYNRLRSERASHI